MDFLPTRASINALIAPSLERDLLANNPIIRFINSRPQTDILIQPPEFSRWRSRGGRHEVLKVQIDDFVNDTLTQAPTMLSRSH